MRTGHRHLLRGLGCLAVLALGFAIGYLLCPRMLPTAAMRSIVVQESFDRDPLFDRRLGDVHLSTVATSALAEFIHDRSEVNVAVALDDFGAPSGLPEWPRARLDLHNATVGQLLQAARRCDPTIEFSDEADTLWLRRNVAGIEWDYFALRIYSVGDLLTNPKLWEVLAEANRSGTTRTGTAAAYTHQECEDCLAQTLTNIDPDSWRSSGGPCGTFNFVGDELVISQYPEIQDQIADLLEILRRIADAQAKPQSAPLARVGNVGNP